MNIDKISAGRDLPRDINVIIEISRDSDPVKYEIDKDSGAVFVDRFMGTAMHYPQNYGFIPHTVAGDGDPVDVLVMSPYPLPPGSVIRCRPIGLLRMTDEGGQDAKFLAVPHEKLSPLYKAVQKPEDFPALILDQIKHFFEHYKDLEPGKWVKVEGWEGLAAAEKEIMDGVKNAAK